MSINANGHQEASDRARARTSGAARTANESRSSGGAAAIVAMSFAFLCLFTTFAVLNGSGVLTALVLGWASSLVMILAGILAMLVRAAWVDYRKTQQATPDNRGSFAGWSSGIDFNAANGNKASK